MALSVNTNLPSLLSQRYLASTQRALLTATERLSSGLRINRASDDVAGLAISERLLAQIRGMGVGTRNANDAISMAQTAESAAGAVADALQRMRELAVQAANGTLDTGDRAILQTEFAELQAEVASLVGGTDFDGRALLDNANTAAFQVGANAGETVNVQNTDLSGLVGGSGTVSTLAVTGATSANASAAITALDTAIDTVASAQGRWGAVLSRLDSVVSNLDSRSLNYTVARGRIVDADYATETANRSRLLILQEFSTAMVAQANAYPQRVLGLLLP